MGGEKEQELLNIIDIIGTDPFIVGTFKNTLSLVFKLLVVKLQSVTFLMSVVT